MKKLRIDRIKPNKNQPRKSFDDKSLKQFSDNIKNFGLLNPITVRPKNKGYVIVQGERRWRACKMAGFKDIQASIVEVDDRQAYLIALTENIQRKDLNPIEEMTSFQKLQEDGMTQEEVAATINKTQSYVAQKLRLSKLPETVQFLIRDGCLTEAHARQLLRIPNFIEKYDYKPFNHPAYKGYDWAEWYQDQLAWKNYGKSVAWFKNKVDTLRFCWFHASSIEKPDGKVVDAEIAYHKKTGTIYYGTHKCIKLTANPQLKRDAANEMIWALKYHEKRWPSKDSYADTEREKYVSRHIGEQKQASQVLYKERKAK